MRASNVRGGGNGSLRPEVEVVSIQEGQVAGVEIRALRDVDLTDMEAWRLSAAAARFQAGRTDELRLPPPPNRSRNQYDRQERLARLLEHFEGGPMNIGLPNENRARAVETMFGTLKSLALVQIQIDRARNADRGLV